MLKTTIAALACFLATNAAFGACFRDGVSITVRGVVVEQVLSLDSGDKTPATALVPVLVLDTPLCIIAGDNDVPHQEISIGRLQVIGTPPPVGVALELKGHLSTRSQTKNYAEQNVIIVTSGRRLTPAPAAVAAVASVPAPSVPLPAVSPSATASPATSAPKVSSIAAPTAMPAPQPTVSTSSASHVNAAESLPMHGATKEAACKAVAALAQKSMEAKRAGLPLTQLYSVLDNDVGTQATSDLSKDVAWLMYTKPQDYSPEAAGKAIYAACIFDGLRITIDLSKHDPRFSDVPRP